MKVFQPITPWAFRGFSRLVTIPKRNYSETKHYTETEEFKEEFKNAKAFTSIPGPSTSDYLSFLGSSKQVSDRPQQEAFFEMLFAKYGDLVRLDHGIAKNIYLADADLVVSAMKSNEFLGRRMGTFPYFMEAYKKKRNLPVGLNGAGKLHNVLIQPLNYFLTDPQMVRAHQNGFRKISELFTKMIEKQADSFTKVPPNLLELYFYFLSFFFFRC